MSNILDYLIPIGALLALSRVAALSKQESGEHFAEHFTISVFLLSMSIGIAVLAWVPVIPSYMIIISVLIIVGMWFKGSYSGEAPI